MKKLRLKEQYVKSDKPRGRYAYLVSCTYPHRRNKYFRSFSTRQEKSHALMHEIEYAEYGFKVRARRANALIDAYEDVSTALYEVEKCWKNNSKRRHQWIEHDLMG